MFERIRPPVQIGDREPRGPVGRQADAALLDTSRAVEDQQAVEVVEVAAELPARARAAAGLVHRVDVDDLGPAVAVEVRGERLDGLEFRLP